MLHRSFKPAKCKTALKMAVSRIKLLKNRRDSQIKQLKRELAKLLESGQDQTARIRVEHVVREEKTMAAYDLIDIYCELIVARLPIIESQKNCPIDLKEAIASVIFASLRCADVPELTDVRKHFTAKYGKEFVNAAVELRPDCGVSRLLVEKLSANAPDGPTKIKILSTIAEENNITWEPKSFGEKDLQPPADLLNGPNTLDKASKMQVDPPKVQEGPKIVQSPTNFHIFHKSNQKEDVIGNVHPQDRIFSSHSQNVVSSNIDANKAGSYHPNTTPVEGKEFRHSYSGREHWRMEFKDATAAAQAAAESAERASMAARAAAELSSQENSRQYSTESRTSSSHGFSNEDLQRYAGSRSEGENIFRNPVHNSLGRNARMQYDEFDSPGQDNRAGESDKLHRDDVKSYDKSRWPNDKSTSDVPLMDNRQPTGRYSRKNSYETKQSDHFSESVGELQVKEVDYQEEVRIQKQSSQASSHSHSSTSADDHFAEVGIKKQGIKKQSRESVGEFQAKESDYLEEIEVRKQSSQASLRSCSSTSSNDLFSEMGIKKQSSKYTRELPAKETEFLEEIKITKQLSQASMHSHSSSFSDDRGDVSNLKPKKLEGDYDENLFAVNDEENHQRSKKETNSYSHAPVVFDDYGLDDDGCKFDVDTQQKTEEYSLDLSPRRKSPSQQFEDMNAQNFGKDLDKSRARSSSQLSVFMERPSSVFNDVSENSVVPSRGEDLSSVSFDDSDGLSSECEEELDKSKVIGNINHSIAGTSKMGQGESRKYKESSFLEQETVTFSKLGLQPPLVDSETVEVHGDKTQGIGFISESVKRFEEMPSSSLSPRSSNFKLDSDNIGYDSCNNVNERKKLQSRPLRLLHEAKDIKADYTMEDSSSESGKELNLGSLTGGLRNKGYRHPPYTRSSNASSKQEGENFYLKMEQSSSSPTVKSSITSVRHAKESYKKRLSAEADEISHIRAPGPAFANNGDGAEDEIPTNSSGSQERYNQKMGIVENKTSSSKVSDPFFHSSGSESEEEFPKKASTITARPSTGFSQRTKASPRNFGSSSKTTISSKSSVTLDYNIERNSRRKSSYATENRSESQHQNKSIYQSGSSMPPELADQAVSTSISGSKRSTLARSLDFSAKDQPSKSLPKSVTSSKAESTPTKEAPPTEKASHVHPKLPDYDSLTAHLLSLRSNRQ